MTKLQLLRRALNERLVAAVEQIMEIVGDTVLEYEQETVRAWRENEILRCRLRWMEGKIPTDWPDEVDFPGPKGSISFTEVPVQECLTVKTEPTDAFDSQSFRPDASLMASVLAAELETVNPGTTEPADASVPGGTVWDSTQNYMAPLDFDPTTPSVSHKSRTGQVRSKTPRCLECKKVFKTVSQLVMHMKTHRKQFPSQEERKEQEDTDKRPRLYHKFPEAPVQTACHMPVCGIELTTCGTRAGDGRKACVYCKCQGRKIKTLWKCNACNVYLCLQQNRNCYVAYHQDGDR